MNNKIKEIDKNMNDDRLLVSEVTWHEVKDGENVVIHGLPFFKENNSLNKQGNDFSRLSNNMAFPDNLKTLSKHPSGGYASFYSDSSSINIEATVGSRAYMSHMSACGQCGLDLYYYEESLQKFVFIGTTKINVEHYRLTLASGLPQKKRLYRLYFPLYISLLDLKIGIDNGSFLEKGEKINEQKILFYGTSITQGGCATRPGVNFSSIIGRDVSAEVINLGFSGSAMLDKEIAQMISSLKNIEVLFIEVDANAGECDKLVNNLESFLDVATSCVKDVFLISHYPLSLALLKEEINKRIIKNQRFQKKVAKKYSNVTFIDGLRLLEELGYEETVDTVHLTDLGFYTLAKKIEKYLKKTHPYLFIKCKNENNVKNKDS